MTALAWPLALLLGLLLAFVMLVAGFVTVIFTAHHVLPRVVPDPKDIITGISDVLTSAGSFVAGVLRRSSALASNSEGPEGDRPETPPNEVTGRPSTSLSERAEQQTADPEPEQPTAA